MRNLVILTVFLLVIFIIWRFGESIAKAETDTGVTTKAETETQKEPEIQPNPMRSFCAYFWDSYYEKEQVEINVSTRGKYDETVIFTCFNCSLEDYFVNPFLNTEYQGKTGMERLMECGFTQAVFKGGRGLEEIVRQVPRTKPNPMRIACANAWNAYYESEKSDINVSTRGEYNETVEFTCTNCGLKDKYVKPFLNAEHQGKTGMDSIKECGFIEAVFKDGKGTKEIVIQVP